MEKDLQIEIQKLINQLNKELWNKNESSYEFSLYYTFEYNFITIWFNNDIIFQHDIVELEILEKIVKQKFNYYIDQLTKLKF